jgi:hypothetical protein
MRREAILSVIASVVGGVAAIAAIVDSLGGGRGLVAVGAATAVAVVTSLLALLYVGRQSASLFRAEAIQAQKDATESGSSAVAEVDRVRLQNEVIPSFVDAGDYRTRSFFLDLVTKLELSEDQAEGEKQYVKGIFEDENLSSQQRAEMLVRHFASRSAQP